MTAEVGDHAAAARSAAAPMHRRVRTGHIVLGMDAAKVGYLADLAAGDDLARQGLDRVLQVVEADHGDGAGLGGAGGQTARLGGGHREGLLAIDVLAGGECRDRDFPVWAVGVVMSTTSTAGSFTSCRQSPVARRKPSLRAAEAAVRWSISAMSSNTGAAGRSKTAPTSR